jgi:hypothetical protein
MSDPVYVGEGPFEVPKGSVAAGRRIRLPRGAERPVKVYVNGVEQREDADYRVGEGQIVFARPILREEKLSGIRWLSMLVGVVGTYRKHETVDVEYTVRGEPRLASDVEILPD